MQKATELLGKRETGGAPLNKCKRGAGQLVIVHTPVCFRQRRGVRIEGAPRVDGGGIVGIGRGL